MSDKPHRVFFALWPDEAALDALFALTEAGAKQCGGRRVRRDSLHLTLLFVGAVSPPQLESLQLAAASLCAEPFQMRLDRLGWWPHNQILWAGCHEVPSCQRRLFESVRHAVQLAGLGDMIPARTAFSPHVTLVRHARCQALPALAEPVCWPVREFALVESFLQPSGARYRTLGRWLLRENA